jgi:hypothetical protein
LLRSLPVERPEEIVSVACAEKTIRCRPFRILTLSTFVIRIRFCQVCWFTLCSVEPEPCW